MADEAKAKKSRVFLVDDHALVREHLTALLQQDANLEVCGEAADARSAFALISQTGPDLVILDLSLKNSNGLPLLKNLKQLRPDLLVLVLSMHDEGLFAERALAAGAIGYITKEEATVDLLSAIRRVLSGQIYLSERMAGRLGRKMAGNEQARTSASPSVIPAPNLPALR